MPFLQNLSEGLPPKPTLTEKHVPGLAGKVYIITGATSGVGLELARILYSKNARVYIGGRSEESYLKAVEDIKAHPARDTEGPYMGELVFMHFDLSDLTTIKPAVHQFLSRERVLHSVWYNAGVMLPPKDTLTAQGYEMHWGTNVVAHFLLNTLLMPILISSAQQLPPNTVRTIWVSSDTNTLAPCPSGINWSDINNRADKLGPWRMYGQSKAGNIILGFEAAQRLGRHGVVSVALNPGHLKSSLQQYVPPCQVKLMNLLLYESRFGAYTELFAGFSNQVTTASNGGYLIPWGRVGEPRKDIKDGFMKQGTGKRLWDMLEREVTPYVVRQ